MEHKPGTYTDKLDVEEQDEPSDKRDYAPRAKPVPNEDILLYYNSLISQKVFSSPSN